MSFRALRIHQQGSATRAVLESLELSELTAGEVVIRVQYSSINYKDALAVTGAGKILRRMPLNAGIDLAGVITESTVSAWQPGQAVLVTGCGLSETLDGGYAEFARVPASAVVALPAGMDQLAAMTLGTAGFTAALAIHQLEHNGLAPGGLPVAVTGATGGVGSLAVNMLAARGYQVCAITGKADADDYLRQLDVTTIVRRGELSLSDAPLEKMQFAAAIDNLGGAWLSWLLRSTQLLGSVASVGLAANAQLSMTVMPFILRGVNLLGITSSNTPQPLRERIWQRLATDLTAAQLTLIRQRVIELDEVTAACADYLTGSVRGRTVVRIPN